MKTSYRYMLAGCFLTALAALMAVSLGISSSRNRDAVCTGLDIVIADSLENSFVTREDIVRYIKSEFGSCTGIASDSIDLVRIERVIDGKSAVLKSEAYMTKDGKLNISVLQRRPAVRFQKQGDGFYADKDGFLFPLQDTYTAYVPVIDGAIPIDASHGYKGEVRDKTGKEWLSRMLALVEYIENDRKWKGNIVQITVLQNGDLVLVPRKGKEKFLFGSPYGIEKKFERIGKYYKGILPDKGEGHYSTVNVKYDGQIVCRK